MSVLLAIETSTETASLALAQDARVWVRECEGQRHHSAWLLPAIDELLAEAGLGKRDLSGVAFGRGPGAFTGVRLAVAVTQAIAFARELPVYPVSSLAAVAFAALQSVQANELILSVLDARMGELYLGAFETHGDSRSDLRALGDECLLSPTEVFTGSAHSRLFKSKTKLGDAQHAWPAGLMVGNGFMAQQEVLASRLPACVRVHHASLRPHAREIAALGLIMAARGEAFTAEQALPVYLRDKVALTEVERGVR